MKGNGIYSVNTLHIPCSPPFYHNSLFTKLLIIHMMKQNMIHVNGFNVMKNEYIPAINM